MNWRIFSLGAAGSVALHLWLIWPARPAAPAAVAPPAEPETKRVAVREVDTERLRDRQRSPEPKAAEAPPPAPAKEPEPVPAAAVLAAAAVAEPAPVPPPPVAQPEPPAPAVAPAQPAAPPQAPAAAQAPAPVAVASAESPVIESGNSPAAVHAGLPRREAVVETAQAPRSDAIESQIERFEAQAAQLAQSAPRPVQMPVADAAPAQAPNPVMPAAAPAPAQPSPAPAVALAPRAAREIPPVEFKPRAPQPAPKSPAFPWLKRGGASVQLAGAPAAAAVTPAPSPARAPAAAAARTGTPAPAVAAGPNGTPTPMAIRREPVPYQPVRFGGGGKADRREVSAAFGQAVDRGAMSALTQAPQDPVARIAWGDPAEALRLLDLGRMALVTVDEDLKVVGGIEPAGGSWRRAASLPNLAAYSNRVRVVDHVAGFAPQAALCGPGEHLAVVVPVGLERRIDRAMDEAARREGLSRTQVVACYGRLVANPTGLEFQVERVERRNGT